MDWSNLSEFKCPRGCGRLTLLKVKRVFLCFECRFACTFDKRRELAAKYPAYIPAATLEHLREAMPGIEIHATTYRSETGRRYRSEKQEIFMRGLYEVTGAIETRATVDAAYGP